MAIRDSRTIDPVNLQQTSKYINDGLTVISNNKNIIPRDANGNVIVQSGSYVIIETNSFNISNSSMLEVLNTRFNYFKFPARTVIDDIPDINLDLDLQLDDPEAAPIIDNVSVQLTIPMPLDSRSQPRSYQKINTSYASTWYYTDEGISSQGFKDLPFTGGQQPNVNSYTITKDILKTLQEQNKTIRFTIQTQYRTDPSEGLTTFTSRLTRRNLRTYNPLELRFLKQQGVDGEAGSANNVYGFKQRDPAVDYPILRITYIVDINKSRAEDIYSFDVQASSPAFVLAENSFWDVDLIDLPDTNNMLYNDIYDINNDTVVFEDGQARIYKTENNGQVANVV